MSFLQAFLVACYYWFAWWDWGMVGNITTNCTFIGFVFGIFFGNIPQGIILGASINSMYLSTVAAGANLPSDAALACCVAIPIALTSGMQPAVAVALSVPFGVLGAFLDNTRRILNGFWNRVARKNARELNFKGITFAAVLGPIIVQFFVRVPIVTAILALLGSNAQGIMAALPKWLINAFAIVGGVLPGIGMVLCATLVGRSTFMPFFAIGFFLMKISNMPVIVIAIFAVCAAVIYVQLAFRKEDGAVESTDVKPQGAEYEGMLSKHMQTRVSLRILFLHRFANSMEALFGTGVGYALMPALREIYKDDEEALKEALERHMQPYISEMTWGNCIMGATLAMEEQKKMGAPIAPEDISAVKTGLMGPFAGFGDSFNWATLAPIIRALFLPFGLAGSFVGVLMEPVVRCYAVTLGWITFRLGYKFGRTSLTQMLRGGWMKKVMTGAGVLGMFMLGAMGASYTTLKTVIVFKLSTGTVQLQPALDKIIPGMLPAIVLGLSYLWLYKGKKYINLVLIVLAVALVTSLLGIF